MFILLIDTPPCFVSNHRVTHATMTPKPLESHCMPRVCPQSSSHAHDAHCTKFLITRYSKQLTQPLSSFGNLMSTQDFTDYSFANRTCSRTLMFYLFLEKNS